MNNILKLAPNTVLTYLEYSHNNSETLLPYQQHALTPEDFHWVLARWPDKSVLLRTLTYEHYLQLNQAINQVPTGKRKHYRQALNAIFMYLYDIAQWQLPKRTEKLFVDRDLVWFTRLSEQAALAYDLWQGYQEAQDNVLKNQAPPCAAQAALTIALEVAPLSLNHLTAILNNPACLERTGQQTQLKVFHYQPPSTTYQETEATFTRYHLTLHSYCFLDKYYQTKPPSLTRRQLLNQLNEHISTAPYHLGACSAPQWHTLFQSLWHHRDNVPPTLLKDISQPERHVDFDVTPPSPKQQKKLLAALYQQDWLTDKKRNAIAVSSKPRWPQRQLIKQRFDKGNTSSCVIPDLKPDNVLEHYLFLYCRELILYGGVQRESLSKATITKYCNIEVCFNDEPLSYEVAIDQEQLQQWAKRVYEKQESDTHKGLVHYFFRFLTTQALTDHLDIDAFESPSLAPTVDPFRIPLTALHEIVDALLTHSEGTLLQRLYCAVSAIIAYFAMLRRGEALRLRIKDIIPLSDKSTAFRITVMKTIEGDTKNHKARTLDVVLPESMAILIHIAIQLKKGCHSHVPLIGFDKETMSSRQLNYLLPVTRAIKVNCGQKARYHHLRKSGIHLSKQQMLQLAYLHPTHDLGAYADLKPMLSPEIVRKKFNYWLEGRDDREINDNLLFDQFTRQVGHQHYATTRWSYLHGTQWLFPYLRPQQASSAQQTFSHAQLRFLFGLSSDSNDLSRQLALLSEHYSNLSISDKQKHPLQLSEHALRAYLWPTKTNHNSESVAEKANENPKYYYQQWGQSATKQHASFIDQLFLNMRMKNYFNFNVLSQVWAGAGKHSPRSLSKTQRTALSGLGTITLLSGKREVTAPNDRDNKGSLIASDQPPRSSLQIQVASNARNAGYFEAVFRQPEWQWLACSFALTVNRKTKVARLLNLVNTSYAKGKEKVTVIKQPEGASHLSITLTPKFPVPELVLQQALQTLTS
ncbi:hypothetical protein GCM10007916_00880 [Psychromonas marina]|uniref:Site-specific integrase n=1 Tax=Psychromonas marina TaxID=88364 RepID=A0ABQ6DV89_9GAMM|nr:hypothetical protein [Psychromonas marina]GLS89021.1 hypothetical protein GCM10007916_00880 [Psychromonas marina]